MSVRGEFRRVVGSYAEFLEGTRARGAGERSRRLRELAAADPLDLSAAAERVLKELGEERTADGPELPLAAERERDRENREHVVAVCRAILGRGTAAP